MVPADLFAETGALLSYGPSWPPIFRNVARFADKILKGANSADLPIEQPTIFELTVNRTTAAALGSICRRYCSRALIELSNERRTAVP